MADWPSGVGCRIIDVVDSTNSEAMRGAACLEAPQWIFAHRQTAGRGRQGKPWLSSAGNFAATLAMRLDELPVQAVLRSFVSALALRDAFVQLTRLDSRFMLKWPNDVLLDGGKVAGILLEFSQREDCKCLLIGFGVNLAKAPEIEGRDPDSPVPTCLADETGQQVPALEFLAALAPAYDNRERQFVESGFAPIREDWLAHAYKLGKSISIRIGKERINGIFQTVDHCGRLIVDCDDGRQTIAAAESVS